MHIASKRDVPSKRAGDFKRGGDSVVLEPAWRALPVSTDFAGILLLVFAAAGIVVLIDRFVLKPKRLAAASAGAGMAADGEGVPEPVIVGYARTILPVLLVVVLFRSFVFEPFHIPSASMMPGLVEGDFILVNKFAYGLRLPVLHTRIVSTWKPQRGDVVVFRSTSGPRIDLIKRLIGLPGDHVRVRDNHIEINGQPVPWVPDGRYQGGYGFTGARLEREKLGAAEHDILLAPGRQAVDFEGVVPPGHYFFMGDNRNDSEDSRFPDVGFVPEDHLIGHAVRIWMSWRLPGWPQWARVGAAIR
jgi:signal peptidase I